MSFIFMNYEVLKVVGSVGVALAPAVAYYYYGKFRDSFHFCIDLNGNPVRYSDELVTIEELSPGDHIFTPLRETQDNAHSKSRLLANIFNHHGVYLGKINGDHKVADFGREVNTTHPVIATLDKFMYQDINGSLYIRRYTSGYIYSVEKTLELADELEGNKEWGPYDLLTNNCEHFATYLKTGVKWSAQV